ncbi:MAG: hypothetical protein QE269_11260 [Fimbriimonas sp.]|jgi:hypothetical protein|nr:hypothetical protein [Fimbriimonas sp.]
MPLKNRVDPFKLLHAVPQRGAWFGNRGCLHDRNGNIKWLQKTDRWIICELSFKDRRRPLFQPGKYTELFFMDEATALAGGHRPCMECRRPSAKQFLELTGFNTVTSLDAQLSSERLIDGPVIEDPLSLPNGAMVGWQFTAYLVYEGSFYRWSFDGYERVASIQQDVESTVIPNSPGLTRLKTTFSNERVKLLTPLTSVRALKLGYPVQISLAR